MTIVNASWANKDEYVYSSLDFVNAYFQYPDERGTITGFAPEGAVIIAYPRTNDGILYTKKYQTITPASKSFLIKVPYKGIAYAVFCISNDTSKNTLVMDWKIST